MPETSIEGRFTPQNILAEEGHEPYKSSKRLKDSIRNTSWPVFRIGLAAYCNFWDKTPDEIMEDRRLTNKSDDEEVKRKHEEVIGRFVDFLGTVKSKRGDGNLAPATINNMLVAVKSFYTNNYYPLVKPKGVDVYGVRSLHVPTMEELTKMLDSENDIVKKAAMLGAAQSGMGIGELTRLTWDKVSVMSAVSDTWGTIREQLENGLDIEGKKVGLIHVHMVRGKTHIPFDTFLGQATVALLKRPDYPKNDKRVFPISIRHLEYITERAARRANIKGVTTPHCFRKFFTTQLKMMREQGGVNNDLIEHWTGHSLGRTKGAYLVPSPLEQAKLYLQVEHRVTPPFQVPPIEVEIGADLIIEPSTGKEEGAAVVDNGNSTSEGSTPVASGPATPPRPEIEVAATQPEVIEPPKPELVTQTIDEKATKEFLEQPIEKVVVEQAPPVIIQASEPVVASPTPSIATATEKPKTDTKTVLDLMKLIAARKKANGTG